MSTNSTYEPYIQLSYKILSTLEDFKIIQKEKENSITDLEEYKQLIIKNESLLNNFQQVKKDVLSQFTFLNVNEQARSSFENKCRELNQILNTIDNCKRNISYLELNDKQESLQKITIAEKTINSILSTLEYGQINSGLNTIKNQDGILEDAVKGYKDKQEQLRIERENEERRKREEEERIRRENEERERRRKEEEELARIEAERRRKEQIELWTKIAKWAGIVVGAVLLIIYVVIPLIQFIIKNIVVILIIIAVIGFIIYKVRDK